jgi:hypothetical protein
MMRCFAEVSVEAHVEYVLSVPPAQLPRPANRLDCIELTQTPRERNQNRAVFLVHVSLPKKAILH